MKGRTQPPPGWSWRRWWLTISGVLAGQVLLVVLLSAHPLPRPLARPAPDRYRILTDPQAPQHLGELPWIGDPAEFALASRHGFSGPIWRLVPQFAHQTIEWSEPPQWLGLEVARLGVVSAPGAETGPAAENPIAERPAPVPGPWPEVTGIAPPSSTLRLEGELAARRLLKPLELPEWTVNRALQSTAVQVIVDARGAVLSAVLLPGGSGAPETDQRALELARHAAFNPVPGPPLTWGRLRFEWQLQGPTSTNPPPKEAAP